MAGQRATRRTIALAKNQRWKASAVTVTRWQGPAIVPGKVAEREADRMALYESTAERLSAHLGGPRPFLQTTII